MEGFVYVGVVKQNRETSRALARDGGFEAQLLVRFPMLLLNHSRPS